MSNAIDLYSNTENPTNPTMGSVLSDYQKTFDFIYLYRQAGDFDETDIIDLYNGSGSSAATTEITNFYKQFSDLDSQTSKNYARQRVAQYDAMIRLYGIYDSLGCIQEGEINESICSGILDEGMSEEFNSLNATILESNSRANQILNQAIRSLKDGCWRIGLQLQETPEDLPVEEEAEEAGEETE